MKIVIIDDDISFLEMFNKKNKFKYEKNIRSSNH